MDETRRIDDPLPSEADLRGFLGAASPETTFELVLPQFKGGVVVDEGPPLTYRGPTFAQRDSRAAFHVQTLLSRVTDPDNIHLRSAPADLPATGTAFFFGSRSNVHTVSLLTAQRPGLFQFEFDDQWKIYCSGKVFSLPDPSRLRADDYQNSDDYGVIARLKGAFGRPVFVIAGLGGRATEACGSYFVKNWTALFKNFGQSDFAIVLNFPPPFDPDHNEVVATAQRW